MRVGGLQSRKPPTRVIDLAFKHCIQARRTDDTENRQGLLFRFLGTGLGFAFDLPFGRFLTQIFSQLSRLFLGETNQLIHPQTYLA